MSKTLRNVPFGDFDPDFVDRIRHGLVHIPITENTDKGFSEVWGIDAKRFAKKINSRKNRRNNKKINREDW